MKKNIIICTLLVIFLVITGCQKKEKNINDLSLKTILKKSYYKVDVPSYDVININKDNFENYFGTNDINFSEAIVSEAKMNAVAHSVGIIRLKNNENINDAIQILKESVNPRKWVCTEAESVIIESNGNVIIVIMTFSDKADKISENFKNI